MLGRRWNVETQQVVGLPAALLHGDVEEVLHKHRRVLTKVELQQLDQQVFLQSKEAQCLHDGILEDECLRTPPPEDAPQLPVYPGEQGLE